MSEVLKNLFEKYMDHCVHVARLRPETVRGYREVFKTFLRIVPEIESAESITEEMLTTFFKRLETRERVIGKSKKVVGIKNSTVRTYGAKLKSFFDWLKQNGYIEENPISYKKLPVAVYEDHRALSREQVEKIITAITQYSMNPLIMKRDMVMVYILLFCGLRKSELLLLQVRDIDLEKKLLTIRAETSKSKRTRHLPIHPTLRLHLIEYLKELKVCKKTSPYLLVGHGGDERFTPHGLKHWVKRISDLSGVKFHVHRFRHTFATNLAHNNVGATKIQKLMGHKQLSMTEVYLRSVNAEDLSEDVSMLSIENLA